MAYSISISLPPDQNDWYELKSNQKQRPPMMKKESFTWKRSIKIGDTWKFWFLCFQDIEKISSGEELDYKLSKNPGWNDGGKLGCKNNSHRQTSENESWGSTSNISIWKMK